MSEEDIDIGPDPSIHESSSGGSLGGLLVGIVIGAVVGASVALMTAPRRGRVVRRKFRRRLEEFGDDARERADEWRDEAARKLGGRKSRRRRHSDDD